MTPQPPHPTEPHPGEPSEFSGAITTARDWLADLLQRLQWTERDTAFRALTACLHALRDSLPEDEAGSLGVKLPPLIRGFYFDGWRPGLRSGASRTRAAFLERIHDGVHRDPAIDPEQVAHAVFALLAARLPPTAIESARAATPAQLHGLWPA